MNGNNLVKFELLPCICAAYAHILIINGEKFGTCFMQFIDFMLLINDLMNTHPKSIVIIIEIIKFLLANRMNGVSSKFTCSLSMQGKFIQEPVCRRKYKVNSGFSACFGARFSSR